MNLNEQLRREFDVLTPLSDDEAIVHNVLERTNAMKGNSNSPKRKARRIIIPVIVAAAMLAAAISVGAATNWDLGSAINNAVNALNNKYYGTEAETGLSSSADIDLSKYGKELDLWYTYDDFKLNIKGVLADTRTAYLFADVVFNDDFVFDDGRSWSDWSLVRIIDTEDGLVCSMDSAIISKDAGTIQFCCKATIHDGESWEGKTLTADFEKLYREIPSTLEDDTEYYSQEFEMNTHVEIPIDFPLVSETTYELNEEIELGAYNKWNKQYLGGEKTGILKSVTISPLNISCELLADTSRMGKGDFYIIDLTVNSADGEIECFGGGSTTYCDSNAETHTEDFSTPINPDDIVSITVCGETIPLKQQ